VAATGGYRSNPGWADPSGARDMAGPRKTLNYDSVHSGAIRGVWGNVHPAVSAVRETPHLTLVRHVGLERAAVPVPEDRRAAFSQAVTAWTPSTGKRAYGPSVAANRGLIRVGGLGHSRRRHQLSEQLAGKAAH
jgi:hypothetical protein